MPSGIPTHHFVGRLFLLPLYRRTAFFTCCAPLFLFFRVILPFPFGIGSERGKATAHAGMEGGDFLHLSPSQQAKVCGQFERFCKDVLRHERIDYIRHTASRAEHVITFSDLPAPALEQLSTQDNYPSEFYTFDVCGYRLPIRDDRLGEALLEIGSEGYSILLLSFLLDLSDRQIALLLNSSKSTIQRRRTAFFEILKNKMKE